MYRLAETTGDTLPVPQLLFSKLTAPGNDEGRFKVALYLLGGGKGDAEDIAAALRLKQSKVEQALQYWEGAGLLEREQPEAAALPVDASARKRMSAQEVAAASNNKKLASLTQELQRILGAPLSPGDITIFTTLYLSDEIPADVILMIAAYLVQQGRRSGRYMETVILNWWRDGVRDAAAVDARLKQYALRARREKDLATQMGMQEPNFSLAECRHIARWYEEYGYGAKMIEAARLAAGNKQNEIKYLAAILKKWHGKGYKTPKDVQQSEENRNLRVTSGRKHVDPKDDLLLGVTGHVPMKSRRSGP